MPKNPPDDDDIDSDDSDNEEDEAPVTFRKVSGISPKTLSSRVANSRRRGARVGGYGADAAEHLANTAIHYEESEWSPQAKKDFVLADKAFRDAQSQEPEKVRNALKVLAGLKTRFCIAHYRGITYGRNNFQEPELRRNHRESVEKGVRPIYSMSVLESAGVPVHDYNAGRYDKDDRVMGMLQENAELLKRILLSKREKKSGGFQYGSIFFDSYADALQHIYTNNYKHTFTSIGAYLASSQGLLKDKSKLKHLERLPVELQQRRKIASRTGFEAQPRDWEAYSGLFNSANPFISAGDTPRHSLKYAYGMKFYGDLKVHRLFPNWALDGSIQKPYAGKVYVLMHDLLEYIEDAPLHVPTLNEQGRIRVGDEIVDERESTFPSFLPRERVVYEHVAKFPSMERYTEHHLEKYGWTSKDFATYRELLFTSPLSIRSQDGTRVQESRPIEAWLVNFHEARLIEVARKLAHERGMILVYKDSSGGLCKSLASVERTSQADQRLHAREKLSHFKGHDYSFEFSKEMQTRIAQLRKDGVSVSDASFQQRSLDERFVLRNVQGDGNCLFRALALAAQTLNIANLTHISARTQIRNYYAANAPFVTACNLSPQHLNDITFPALDASDVNRWGSESEIMAFALKYQVNITVHLASRPRHDVSYTVGGVIDAVISAANQCVQFIPHAVAVRTIHLLHENGNHWTWLQEK